MPWPGEPGAPLPANQEPIAPPVRGQELRWKSIDGWGTGHYTVQFRGLAVTSGPETTSSAATMLSDGSEICVLEVTRVGSRIRGRIHIPAQARSGKQRATAAVNGWVTLAAPSERYEWVRPTTNPSQLLTVDNKINR